MSVPSAEAPVDDVVITLPRRRTAKSYSSHGGVGRIPATTPPATPAARATTRLRQPPPHPADVAQSQLFETILLTEIDELEDRAAAVERRRRRLAERKVDAVDTLPQELKQLRQRITEARRLLGALRQRFPLD